MAKINFNDAHGTGISKRRTARSNLLFGFILLIVGFVADSDWQVIIILAGIVLIIRGMYLKYIYKE